MASGVDYLQGILDQGYVPATQVPGTGLPGRMPISDRDQLYEYLLSEAGKGRLGFTSQDIYDFFTAPKESQAILDAQDRFKRYLAQGRRASAQGGGELASRLGIGGGLGERMGRSIAADMGGREAARGYNQATATAVEGINRPGRFMESEMIGSALGQKYASDAQDVEMGAGLASAAGEGLQSSGNPVAMAIGFLLEQGAKAAGHFGAKDILKQGQAASRRYQGRGLTGADFSSAVGGAGQGFTYNPGGSNEQALSSMFAPGDRDTGNFLYGA